MVLAFLRLEMAALLLDHVLCEFKHVLGDHRHDVVGPHQIELVDIAARHNPSISMVRVDSSAMFSSSTLVIWSYCLTMHAEAAHSVLLKLVLLTSRVMAAVSVWLTVAASPRTSKLT
jgi:hypothetical protein